MTYLPALTSTGSIESYIQAVNAIPMLSQEEELFLADDFQNRGNLDSAKKLVLSHLRVVVSIARGYTGYGLPHADLIQEGSIGLMKAVKRFEPSRGVRLFSFAVHWIKAEIHEYILKNWRLVKVATTKPQRKLFFNLRSMKHSLAALSPTEVYAIAKDLDVKPEEVREMEIRMGGHDIPLLAQDDSEEDGFAPVDWLSDETNEPTQRIQQNASDWLHSEGIQYALAQLDSRSQRIIEARWLNEGEEKTLHQLAAEFSVSAERIRQLEQKALIKLREVMSSMVD